jgi:ParB family chromosome partitioning protein
MKRREMIPIEKIAPHPKNQRFFRDLEGEELDDLAKSLSEQGMIQCPVVCSDGNGGYVLLCGHQRLRAAKMLGWDAIEVEIRDVAPDSYEAELILISENLHRRQLSHGEIKRAALRLLELGRKKRDVAETLGVDIKTLNHTLIEDKILPALRRLIPQSTWQDVAEWPTDVQKALLEKIQEEAAIKEQAVRQQLKSKIKELDEQSKAHLRRAADAERRAKSLENILEKKKAAIEALSAEKTELQSQIHAMQNQMEENPDNAEIINELQMQLAELESSLQNARQERDAAQNLLEDVKRQYEEVMHRAEERMAEAIEQARTDAERKAREELEVYIQEQTERIQASQEENARLQEQLKHLEEQMREITHRPVPVLITQYLSSCLMADRMGEVFAGQLREIEITIEGKSRQDPESFQAIPKPQVQIWISRLRAISELCTRIADQYAIWHRVQ